MNTYPTLRLPISIQEDTLLVDEQFLKITEINSFLTKNLKDYYLSTSSVYPKIVYKTYFIEEAFDGPLTKAGLNLKVTTVYPDVVGIEFAKTKTVRSELYPRLLEVMAGNGLLILEQDESSATNDLFSYVLPLATNNRTVIPPNWHYTLVNTSSEQLVTVEYYKKDQTMNNCNCDRKGSGIYIVERNGTAEIVKNSQYKNLVKYATVYPEKYAAKINIAPTGSFLEDMDHIIDHLFGIEHSHWSAHLNDTDNNISTF